MPHWDNTPGDPGMDSTIRAIVEFDDDSGSGPALYAGGGWFDSVGGLPANYIATWQGCAVESIPSDLNGDGVVDGADLLILLSHWGTCDDPDECPADLNNDGHVDGVDLLILLSNWGCR